VGIAAIKENPKFKVHYKKVLSLSDLTVSANKIKLTRSRT